MISKAFLLGIIEMVDKDGLEETTDWLQRIGIKLAEIEGPGFEMMSITYHSVRSPTYF